MNIWMHRCRLFCHNQGIYLYEYIQVTKHLTLLWLRSLSYRNQSSDLLCKSMNWFLYDRYLHHDSVKTLFTHHIPKVCSYMLWSRICFFCCFFLSQFSFKNIHNSHDSRGKGRLSLYILSTTSTCFTVT